MTYRNTKAGYGSVTRALHWVMALGIFGLFALGWWMRDLTYTSPYYQTAPEIHESVGLAMFGLLLFRFVWRLINLAPDDSELTDLERKGSALMHWGFYPLLLGLMITGYLISTLDGRSITVFWLFDVPSFYTQKGLEELAGQLHWILAYLTVALGGLHGGAALWHHFVKKDRVMIRMLKKPTDV